MTENAENEGRTDGSAENEGRTDGSGENGGRTDENGENGGRSREGEVSDGRSDAVEPANESKGTGGVTFRLPSIRLPPLFPDSLRLQLPVPGFRRGRRVGIGWILFVCLGFDIFDLILALSVAGPIDLVRTVGGVALALVVADWIGLLYAWEVLAVLLGYSSLTVVPSLVGLLLVHLVGGRSV